MAFRRGGRVQVPSTHRRQTEWIASADVAAFTTLAAATVVLDQSIVGSVVQSASPFTIVRTVGYIAVKSDQETAVEEPFGAMGAIVVQETARVAGVASLPDPITEEDDDGWFLYQGFAIEGLAAGSSGMKVFPFDSKAQRKVKDGDAVVFVVTNAHSTFGLQYVLKFRLLIKLF